MGAPPSDEILINATANDEFVLSGEAFAVEDLFDFSNDGDKEDEEEDTEEDDEEEDAVTAVDASSVDSASTGSAAKSSSGRGDGVSGDAVLPGAAAAPSDFAAGELCQPLQYEVQAELEWLSNIIEEDSFTSEEDLQKLQLISGVGAAKPKMPPTPSRSAPTPVISESLDEISFPEPKRFRAEPAPSVPAKARSKRSRQPPNSWASRLLVLPSSSPESSQITSSMSLSDESSDVMSMAMSMSTIASSAPQTPMMPIKKPSSKKKDQPRPTFAPAPDGRRCLHCETDKTPQWRTGPMGPKTLCNACGVRYKSGRLVPEYRPAASPTFIMSKHSNSHRKVLELRRQKELHTPLPAHFQVQQHPPQHQMLMSAAGLFDIMPPPPMSGDDFLIHHRIGPDFRQLI